jgi:hypothetical protein
MSLTYDIAQKKTASDQGSNLLLPSSTFMVLSLLAIASGALLAWVT